MAKGLIRLALPGLDQGEIEMGNAIGWLGAAKSWADLGRSFGGGLSEAEVRYLMDKEWARTAEDVLWRRTKLGLRLSAEQAAGLKEYLGR